MEAGGIEYRVTGRPGTLRAENPAFFSTSMPLHDPLRPVFWAPSAHEYKQPARTPVGPER